jgi:hypothetical protein
LDPTVLAAACKPAAQARNRREATSKSGTEKITDSLE